MRIVSFGDPGVERPGVLVGGDLLPLDPILGSLDLAGADVRFLIEQWDWVRAPLEAAIVDPPETVSLERRRLGPPVTTPPSIVGVGANYPGVFEDDRGQGPGLLFFGRPRTTLCGPEDPVPRFAGVEALAYEIELGVVIGRRGKMISVEQAHEHVFGYTVANDLTAFDVLFGGHAEPEDAGPLDVQMFKAKGYDGSLPCGPCIVTCDEIGETADLKLTLSVNGEIRQESTAGRMRRGVAEIVAALSEFMTLSPGDIVLTGSPVIESGRSRFVAPGDIMEAEIPGVGRLRNEVVSPPQVD